MEEFKQLIKSFASIQTNHEMEKLFNELFTEKERLDISSRWLLMKALIEGQTQREIANKYHLSLCKITRGAKIIKDSNSICRKLITEQINK